MEQHFNYEDGSARDGKNINKQGDIPKIRGLFKRSCNV